MLALWAYNWSWDSVIPPPASTSSTDIVVASLASGGNGRDRGYVSLTDDYWEQRQAALQRGAADAPSPTSRTLKLDEAQPIGAAAPVQSTSKAATQPQADRSAALAALKNAASLEEMRAASARLREMDARRA